MSYSRSKIQDAVLRFYSRYDRLLDEVDYWVSIGVLDELPLQVVEIWENDPEREAWGPIIQEDNRILHEGFAIDVGEDWVNEELSRVRRSRFLDEELRFQMEHWALQAVRYAEEGEIVEEEPEESDSEEVAASQNWEVIA